jgi:hypothetical protein
VYTSTTRLDLVVDGVAFRWIMNLKMEMQWSLSLLQIPDLRYVLVPPENLLVFTVQKMLVFFFSMERKR